MTNFILQIAIPAILLSLSTPNLSHGMEIETPKSSCFKNEDNTMDMEQPKSNKEHRQGKRKQDDREQLEAEVFELVIKNNITVNILQNADREGKNGHGCCLGQTVSKLPKNKEELRQWCTQGYQYKENEGPDINSLFNPQALPSGQYSFHLFRFGVHTGSLPVVQYILGYHNHFWSQADLSDKLSFSLGKDNFTFMTYLIKKDYVEIFDYLTRSQEFKDIAFGPKLKNAMGNTPLHTLAKYGSKAMIERFLKEQDLVDLCLKSENISGENGANPLQIAQRMSRPEEISSLFEEPVLHAYMHPEG